MKAQLVLLMLPPRLHNTSHHRRSEYDNRKPFPFWWQNNFHRHVGRYSWRSSLTYLLIKKNFLMEVLTKWVCPFGINIALAFLRPCINLWSSSRYIPCYFVSIAFDFNTWVYAWSMCAIPVYFYARQLGNLIMMQYVAISLPPSITAIGLHNLFLSNITKPNPNIDVLEPCRNTWILNVLFMKITIVLPYESRFICFLFLCTGRWQV